ncbi:MAG TPA: lytic transglycosylase domain-containing protein [Acetobacteraceae bacterium]|nr:lytic transglycosylase domain-containing protein [Acetobacteraceae bacterium]
MVILASLNRPALARQADAPDPKLERAVQDRTAAGEYVTALGMIDAAGGLSAPRTALLRADVAHALFARSWDGVALQVATSAWAAAPEGERVGFAGFVAGLAAWRLGRPALALGWFDQAAHAPIAPASVRAAGAFWAARACLRLHDSEGYKARLRQAAMEQDTFHGLIARHLLHWRIGPPRAPLPMLRPVGGFVIDPALVYGLTRTESNFDPAAVSPAGARGLMQIMPVTARAVSGNAQLGAAALHDPGLNLGLGQRVLLSLAERPGVRGDLLRLLAGYNAGGANAATWASELRDGGDPLLFLEAIPLRETRRFIQRVLTHTWIYAARLGLPALGLDDLGAGRWPRLRMDRAGNVAVLSRPVNWNVLVSVPHPMFGQQFARSGP